MQPSAVRLVTTSVRNRCPASYTRPDTWFHPPTRDGDTSLTHPHGIHRSRHPVRDACAAPHARLPNGHDHHARTRRWCDDGDLQRDQWCAVETTAVPGSG